LKPKKKPKPQYQPAKVVPVLEAAIAYWTGQLVPQDKREDFRNELSKLLYREAEKDPALVFYDHDGQAGQPLRLNVDYDPQGILLTAIRNVGIECQGVFFSAQGLFPYKTRTYIRAGRFWVSEGYGSKHFQVHPKLPSQTSTIPGPRSLCDACYEQEQIQADNCRRQTRGECTCPPVICEHEHAASSRT
jgi:hypothetical protein